LVSFDCTLGPLQFALDHAEQLTYPLAWKQHLSELAAKHSTNITFANGGTLTWTLCLADFTTLPTAPAPDGIIYDPYSPAKNLPMWSLSHFSALRKRLSRPAVLTSYSRSTAVRVTLLLAGFYVGIGGATGEKEQTTVAATEPGLLRSPLPLSWLKRVRMSTSARPLGSPRGPISDADLLALEAHPQFSAEC
jgi:tRNA U34 5-methylaminomethyl-2-thiouridine-forming methyltransferase MnmC